MIYLSGGGDLHTDITSPRAPVGEPKRRESSVDRVSPCIVQSNVLFMYSISFLKARNVEIILLCILGIFKGLKRYYLYMAGFLVNYNCNSQGF